jgi:hypothetical protein
MFTILSRSELFCYEWFLMDVHDGTDDRTPGGGIASPTGAAPAGILTDEFRLLLGSERGKHVAKEDR